MALEELEKRGYKPQKKPVREAEAQVDEFLKKLGENETKRLVMDLLIEGLSDPDPREILVYGTFVKRYLEPIIGSTRDDRIEKTLKLLGEAITQYIKHGRS